jgi:lipoyl-dependent peroxiredoxin
MVKVLYTAHGSATGGGREGSASTDDKVLDVKLTTPKELGGSGATGTNPEQLFSVGYSACFLGAMRVASGQTKIKVPEGTTVTATVGIGPRSEGGFGITAELDAYLPGLSEADARTLVEATHGICPYSNAIKASVDVKTTTRA